jgi:hypothetical protein
MAVLDLNIVRNTRIDFVVVGELAAEADDADPLARLQSAHVDASRGVDEYLRRARAVVDKDAVAVEQIILHRLNDPAGELEQSTLGGLAYSEIGI